MQNTATILCLLLLSSFSISAQKYIMLPEVLKSAATMYTVTKPNKEFQFDQYRISKRTMEKSKMASVTNETNLANPAISDVTDSRTRRTYSISFMSSSGEESTSDIVRLFFTTEMQINSMNQLKIGKVNLTPTSSTLSSIDADLLEVNMRVSGDTVDWKLVVVQEIVSGALSYSGFLSDGSTNISIVPEFELNNEEPTKWDKFPVNKFIVKGFIFYLEEQPIAAVQVAPSLFSMQVWLMPDLDEKLKFVLAAAMPNLYFEFRERM